MVAQWKLSVPHIPQDPQRKPRSRILRPRGSTPMREAHCVRRSLSQPFGVRRIPFDEVARAGCGLTAKQPESPVLEFQGHGVASCRAGSSVLQIAYAPPNCAEPCPRSGSPIRWLSHRLSELTELPPRPDATANYQHDYKHHHRLYEEVPDQGEQDRAYDDPQTKHFWSLLCRSCVGPSSIGRPLRVDRMVLVAFGLPTPARPCGAVYAAGRWWIAAPDGGPRPRTQVRTLIEAYTHTGRDQ